MLPGVLIAGSFIDPTLPIRGLLDLTLPHRRPQIEGVIVENHHLRHRRSPVGWLGSVEPGRPERRLILTRRVCQESQALILILAHRLTGRIALGPVIRAV